MTAIAAVEIDLSVEAGEWDAADAEALARRTIDAAMAGLDIDPDEASEISILLTDDAHIRRLNAEWRDKDKATNVLSFPAFPPPDAGRLPPMLGDIVIAEETVRREAADEGKPFENHLAHLILHGLLHLLGHDHEDEAAAEAMEALERRILGHLAIPDPYR